MLHLKFEISVEIRNLQLNDFWGLVSVQQLRLIAIVRKNKCFMCNRQVQAWRGKGISVLPFPCVLCGAGVSFAWQSLGQQIYPKPSKTIFLSPPQKAWNYLISALCSFWSQFLFFLKGFTTEAYWAQLHALISYSCCFPEPACPNGWFADAEIPCLL